MLLKYNVKPVLVKSIWAIAHKGKSRNYAIATHVNPTNRPYEMIFVDYGKINLTLGKKNLLVSPGECIFLSGGKKHSFYGVDGAPFDYLNIMFSGEIPPSLFGKVLTINRKCFELATKLKQESIQDQPYRCEVIASCLTEFIAYLLRKVELSVPHSLTEHANYKRHQSEVVNRALNVIASEYSKPLSMKMLCRSSGIGESRLRQLLKIETGGNFRTLLHKQRIAVAEHLLREGNYSLEEISSAVGYSYPSFFFKVFKRIMGIPPGAYASSLGEPTDKV